MSKKSFELIERLSIVMLAVSIGACSIAPLTGPNSAKTVGTGKLQTVTTVSPTFGQSITYGLNDKTDIGALVEVQLVGVGSVWVKRSFLNNDIGHSVAGIAGAFLSAKNGNTYGFYIGPSWSYSRGDAWELYGLFKYNHVEWSGHRGSWDEDDFYGLADDADSFDYLQLHGGAKYFFSPQFNIDVGLLMLMSGSVIAVPLPSVGFGWRLK